MSAVETPRDQLGFLTDDAALDAFVAAWQDGTLPKAAWTHAAHVAVCAFYCWGGAPVDRVFATMKAGILAYNAAVGTANTATSGYHETLTRFWAEIIVTHVAAVAPGSRLDAVRSAVDTFGHNRQLHAAYYRGDVVRDPVARARWVAPGAVTNQDN